MYASKALFCRSFIGVITVIIKLYVVLGQGCVGRRVGNFQILSSGLSTFVFIIEFSFYIDRFFRDKNRKNKLFCKNFVFVTFGLLTVGMIITNGRLDNRTVSYLFQLQIWTNGFIVHGFSVDFRIERCSLNSLHFFMYVIKKCKFSRVLRRVIYTCGQFTVIFTVKRCFRLWRVSV